jgi:predicted permease
MTDVFRDIRFALRSFANNRGFAAAVAVSIALGIAANTTVFTMVNALLLGDLPVRQPERLVGFANGRSFSWPNFVDYREQTKSVFEDVSAHFPLVPASIGGGGEPERLWGQVADTAYFSMVGVPMQLGRGFLPSEDNYPHKAQVVVLSDSLWRRRFAADPGIIGREVVLNNVRYSVVGVTAAGFKGVDRGVISEFWVPLSLAGDIMPDLHAADMRQQRNAQWLLLVARLKPGVSRQQAVTVVNTVQQRLDAEYRKGERPRPGITLSKVGGLPAGTGPGATAAAAVMMVVVGLVLLIACVNVASLMLARATVRQKEIGIRLSVGASRGRLIRQLLTESILLSLIGSAMGLAGAYAATRAISGFEFPLPIPVGFQFVIDLRVLLFTTVLALVTGVLFGLAPALRATRPDLVTALKNETSASARTRRFGARSALVLVQVSLSLVLLVGAGLFVRSLQNAASIDLGMRTDHLLMMTFDPKLHHYSPEKTRQFVAQVRERVAAVPGVTAVTFVDSLPLSIGGTNFDFKPVGMGDKAKSVNADVYTVGSGYFAAMGIPLRRGRDFNLHRDTGKSLILNEEAARQMFPGRDPLGQELELGGLPGASGKQRVEVIGVARNSKSRTLGENATAMAYLYLEAKPEDVFSFYGITIIARTAGTPGSLAGAVRAQIHALDPNLPLFNVKTMEQHVNLSMLLPRLSATLLGLFGAIGIVLATVGLYGVVNFAARARTREIGIRMALGARPAGVLRLFLRDGLVLVGVGLAIGLALSLAVTRFTASLLYGVSAHDTATFIGVPALMLAVAVAAVYIPARRAAKIDPLEALHHE